MQELSEEIGSGLMALEKDDHFPMESPMPGLSDEPVQVALNARMAPNRSTFVGYWFGLKFVEFEVLKLDGRFKYTVLP